MLTTISKFIGNTFAYWTILFALLGFSFPDIFIPLKMYIPHILGIIMFGMGLTLSAKDFSEVVKQPKQVLIGVLGQFIIMPSLALLLTLIFKLGPEITLGILLVGCCPGGTSSNVITFLSKGDVALSVTVTSITTMLAPLATPLLLYLLAEKMIAIDFWPMMLSIINMVIIPIFIGLLVRICLGKKTAYIMPVLPIISVTGIVFIVATVVALNQLKIREIGLIVGFVVILHNLFGYLIGYYLAKFTGMKMPQRKAISIEVGMQNSGLGASLATVYFSPLAAVPSALFSVWHNISGALLANFFQKIENEEKIKS